ncbi:DUF72 domain-containing protein [Gallaecimonas xiamenensis]|uniref:DUF72 domain-containing protein n=1 Tax=Gallaecimonas xiamenensis 3-C-1 TaxID=745411 RepID=K2J2F0_9GAMM|nr:DUF72 domain-containing protein [Gallaecimonas xiamenensis]EKE69238.1 hypothetical protein B3C1_15587 [Gallaecimonas xiamenensis 3-C-1]
MWSHPAWKHLLYPPGTPQSQHLAHYAKVFNAIEGNTSFYALPSEDSVKRWQEAVPAGFRFTFKFPQSISHHKALVATEQELDQFLTRLAPLHSQISHYLLQLPASFGPAQLGALAAFVEQLPPGLPLALEVRHSAFFQKGEAERALNRYLMDKGIDRIIMDSRPVFSMPASNPALVDAQQKKPRVPVHAIATGQRPVVRFVGLPEPALNHGFLAPWVSKVAQWLDQGLSPHFFVHSADNDQAPLLARWFYDEVAKRHTLPALPPFAQAPLF